MSILSKSKNININLICNKIAIFLDKSSKAWVLRSNRSGITENKRKSSGENIVGFLFFFYKCL